MSAQRGQVLDYSWLHDDTEEDLVGADWQQHAIRALSTSLQALADERRWPWHVGDQLTLVGEKPNGKEWRPAPDVSIHPQLGPEQRQDIDVRVEGPPALVLEVASASTWRYDVSLESTRRGKRQAARRSAIWSCCALRSTWCSIPGGSFWPARSGPGGVSETRSNRGCRTLMVVTTASCWAVPCTPMGPCCACSIPRGTLCPTGLRLHGQPVRRPRRLQSSA